MVASFTLQALITPGEPVSALSVVGAGIIVVSIVAVMFHRGASSKTQATATSGPHTVDSSAGHAKPGSRAVDGFETTHELTEVDSAITGAADQMATPPALSKKQLARLQARGLLDGVGSRSDAV